jgi:hypothetical protein
VRVQGRLDRGRIVLEYRSRKELGDLLAAFGVALPEGEDSPA